MKNYNNTYHSVHSELLSLYPYNPLFEILMLEGKLINVVFSNSKILSWGNLAALYSYNI